MTSRKPSASCWRSLPASIPTRWTSCRPTVYSETEHGCRTDTTSDAWPRGERRGERHPAPALAEGPGAWRPELRRLEAAGRRAAAAHRVRERALSEYRGLLEPPHGDLHDPGRHLHARLRLLRYQD